jgi:hypothetical protein
VQEFDIDNIVFSEQMSPNTLGFSEGAEASKWMSLINQYHANLVLIWTEINASRRTVS